MMESSTSFVKIGDQGAAVKALQTKLNMRGYRVGELDGIFGTKTKSAVEEFQRAVELPADGIVGPMTAAKLRMSPWMPGLDAISRLIQFNQRGKYVLGAGGTNPRQETPFTWVGAMYGSDCIGAVMWALGCPRHHPSFPEYEGDINCDSAMMDAGIHPTEGGKGSMKFFEPVERWEVVPGVLAVLPSIRAKELWPGHEKEHGYTPNKRVRIGHIGFVVGWEGLTDPFKLDETPWDGDLRKLVTLECRYSFPAVRLGRNVSFTGNTHYKRNGQEWTNEKWGVRFMKFVAQ